MKAISNIKVLLGLIVIFMLASCKEEEGPTPFENNTNPPGQVSNVYAEGLAGSVYLTYTLPGDQDLLYVKANYTLANGTPMEVKSSYYLNHMTLEGFRGDEEISIQLRAVNRSEIASEPVTVKVTPLPSPIFDVFESLTSEPDFGGMRVTATNETYADLAILIMEKNNVGDWEPIANSIYTSTDSINRSIRGYDTIPTDFAITVRDRWLNTSDTLFKEITPLYETIIPISGYSPLILDNDPEFYDFHLIEYLWDGLFYWPYVFLTLRDDPTPHHTVTMDMGTTAKLSRVKMWQYPEPVEGVQTYYYLGDLRYFRIWGSAEAPDPTGTWDSWTLLGEYEIVKPSGLPYGQQSNEDVLQAEAGEDFEIPLDAPPVRYIRIESLECWNGQGFIAIMEMYMYGDPNY